MIFKYEKVHILFKRPKKNWANRLNDQRMKNFKKKSKYVNMYSNTYCCKRKLSEKKWKKNARIYSQARLLLRKYCTLVQYYITYYIYQDLKEMKL